MPSQSQWSPPSPPPGRAAQEQKIAEMEQQLDRLNAKIGSMVRMVDQCKEHIQALEKEVATIVKTVYG